MNGEPTMWDFLTQQREEDFQTSSQEDWESEGYVHDPDFTGDYEDKETLAELWQREGYKTSESQQSIVEYLAKLLGESGKFSGYDPEGVPGSMGDQYWKEIEKLFGLEGFQDMSRGDLSYALGYGAPGVTRSESMQTMIDEKLDFVKALQEGLGSIKTFDEYGGKSKVSGVEKEAESDIASAYAGYIPGEILSRYGALQGKNTEAAGEMAEQEYISEVSAVDRRKGRGVGSIYEEYEEGLFDDISGWLS